MALRLRSALLLSSSLLIVACTTIDSGFVADGMPGVGTTGGDLRLDALAIEAPAPPDAAVDAPPDPPDAAADADAAPADRPAPPPDVAPDRTPDQAPDGPPPVNLANGATCGAATWCKSGFCVDGICCDKACNNGCMACSQTRTGSASGTCGVALDLAGKACGKACGVVEGKPAVVQKVCQAGACGFPAVAVPLERCLAENACMTVFCDDPTARCVATGCAAGACCCTSAPGTRACVKREMCTGARMCAP
jgi:hypothetical protein